MLVADIYNPNIFPIHQDLTIKEALKLLVEKHFNGVVVLDTKGHLVGIFSLQDVAAATVPTEMRQNTQLAGALYKPNFFHEMATEVGSKKVSEVMRKDFITATVETSVMEIAAEFLHNDLYLVPVVEDKKVIGIVTRSEIKNALIKVMFPTGK